MPLQSFIAGGDIYPARFVKLDSTTDGQVLQCGSGDIPIGVSQLGTRRNSYVDSSGKAAAAGEPVQVFDLNSECALEMVAACNPGQYLKPDTNGKGTPVTTDNDYYGAVAAEVGAAGKYSKVKVVYGQQAS